MSPSPIARSLCVSSSLLCRSVAVSFGLVFLLGSVSSSAETVTTFRALGNYPTSYLPQAGVATDFNGDGVDDLATASLSGFVNVLLSDGDGGLDDRSEYPIAGRSVAAADFDGDGIPDLAFSQSSEERMTVLYNNGDGTFGGRKDYPVPGFSTRILTGDFDGDGWPDVATGNFSVTGDTLSVFLNDSAGGFIQKDYPLPGTPYQLANVDVNRDGAPDIAVSMSGVAVLVNDGDGDFRSPENLGIGAGANSLISADFNNDGIGDLVAPGYRVYLGESSGGFSEAPSDTLNYSRAAAHGDFNGDGNLDLAFATSMGFVVHHGDGTGKFHTPRTFHVNSTSSALVPGDFNNDGKLDIVCVIPSGVGVFLNVSNPRPEIDLNGPEAGTSTAITLVEEDGPAAIAPTLTVTDDSGVVHWARVRVLSSANRYPTLASAGGPGLTVSYDPARGVLDIKGEASVATYEAALRSVTFQSLDSPAEPFEVVFTVNDSFVSTSASASVTIDRAGDAAGYVVTTTSDTGDGGASSGGLSLREAILAANADPGAEVITFAEELSGAIELIGPLPDLEDRIVIRGPGADILTVRRGGGNSYRIFTVTTGTVAAITGLTLSDGDVAGRGGAIANSGSLFVEGCHLKSNTATEGGAIFNNGTLSVLASTLSGNAAERGGAVYNATALDASSTKITSTTLSGNTASRSGGGIHNASGAVTIVNSTITANTASRGAGITSRGDQNTRTSVTNTILAGNTGPDVDFVDGFVNPFSSGGHNLVGDGRGSEVFSATGDRSGMMDPRLTPLQDNGGPTPTHAPLVGSLVLGAGSTSLGVDQRGVSRPQGDRDDIGAVEADTDLLPRSLVVSTTSDENNGTSSPAVGSGTSLREAIIYANSRAEPSVITFAPNVSGTIGLLTNPLPTLTADIEIRGPGADWVTITRVEVPDQEFRHITVGEGATVSMSGLTLTGGHALTNDYPNHSGGAIYNAGELTLSDCVITGNNANAGAGVYNDIDGNLTILRCTISDNRGEWNNPYASSSGGGIYSRGTMTIISSTISGNIATSGGGIYNLGTLNLTNSTVSGNKSNFGGGIQNSRFLTIVGSTITRNQQEAWIFGDEGAGVATSGGENDSVTVVNSIIADNIGTDVGNSALIDIGIPTNTDEGTSSDTEPAFTSNGHNLIGTGNATGDFTATTDRAGVDPKLGPLQFNGGPTKTHHPQPGSLAIDRGKASLDPDQRGVDRPQGPWSDIGAVEAGLSQSGPHFQVNTLEDIDSLDSAFASLRSAIEAANSELDVSTITFAEDLSGSIDLATPLPVLTTSINIVGPGAENLTIRPAEGKEFRVLHIAPWYFIPDAHVSLNGLTISGGVAQGAEPADRGGGILNEGSLELARVTVRGNTADFGGGIANLDGTVKLTESTVADNSAESGGGIFHKHGILQVFDSAVIGNAAITGGGGIVAGADTEGFTSGVAVINSTFAGNTTVAPPDFGFYGGGAIANFSLLSEASSAQLVIINSTFVDNSEINGVGAAIFNFLGQMDLANSLLIGNTSIDTEENSSSSDAEAQMYAPEATVVDSMIGLPDGYLLSDIVGPLGDFGGPTQTIPLMAGSPAIDGGDASSMVLPPWVQSDQRGTGFNRIEAESVDIGAYELFAPPAFDQDALSLMAGVGPVDLSDATGAWPSDGIFSGIGVDAATGVFDPAGAGVGDYTITYTVTDEFGISNRATFTMSVSAVDFDNWSGEHFDASELDDPAVSGSLADADGDGVPNLVEFAFGTDPRKASSGPGSLVYAGTLAGGGTLTAPGVPKLVELPGGDGIFDALFIRRVPSVTDGLSYNPQFSADLNTWEDSSAAPFVLASDGLFEILRVPFPPLVDGKSARFFRVEITNAD